MTGIGLDVSQAGAEKLFLPLLSESTPREVYYVVASTTGGPNGDYSATPLSVVSDFQTDLFSGAFETSYPIPVPPSVAGPVPGVALHYNSLNVAGMTTNTNNQAGHAGLGWDIEAGAITLATYRCPTQPTYICSTGQYYITLNGVQSKLVNVSGNLYRLQSDPSWKVERFTGGADIHPDYSTKVYWIVTTPDGIRYRFGGEKEDENAGWGRDLNSVATMPLKNDSFPQQKAYKWYLDRVEDTHGNLIYYFYAHEYNLFREPSDSGLIPTCALSISSTLSTLNARGRWFSPMRACALIWSCAAPTRVQAIAPPQPTFLMRRRILSVKGLPAMLLC